MEKTKSCCGCHEEKKLILFFRAPITGSVAYCRECAIEMGYRIMTKNCDRCGIEADRLYPCYHVHCHDDTPHEYDEQYCGKKIMICWDCDFEVTNGRGEPDDDFYEVMNSRWEDDYAADPINVDRPWWL